MSKTILITGASDGIGAAAAAALAEQGHTIAVIGRSETKTRQVAESIGSRWFVADFAEFASVRALAASLASAYPRIDVLANNAGGVFGSRATTIDGFERTFQVNHLSPFLLTNLLLPTLLQSAATVIQTSSIAARLYGKLSIEDLDNDRRFSANRAYGDSKLENILFTRELHRRYHAQGLSAAAFHPGVISTGFAGETTSIAMRLTYGNPISKLLLGSPATGADQLVWLASTAPGTEWKSGEYYEKRTPAKRVNPRANDLALAQRLWDRSAELAGLTG